MLQKNQMVRASVTDVLNDAWLKLPFRRNISAIKQLMSSPKESYRGVEDQLMADDRPPTSLVAVETLTVEDHDYIVETLISSDITTREDITRWY